jgi:hypothetical protein
MAKKEKPPALPVALYYNLKIKVSDLRFLFLKVQD